MSKKEDDDYAAWQANFSKEFEADPEAQAAWATLTGKAADKVREHFYRGTLRQDEFHRRLNETQSEKQKAAEARAAAEQIVQQSQEWYAMSRPEYERAVKKAEVLAKLVQDAGLIGEGQPAANDGGRQVSEQAPNGEVEQLRAIVAGISQGLPNYMRDFGVVTDDLRRNNWSTSMQDVQAYSTTRGVSLQQALNDLTAEERQKRAEEAVQKQIEAGVQEKLRERMASLPTPDFARGGPSSGLAEFQKQMEAIGDKNTRREVGLSSIREALISK